MSDLDKARQRKQSPRRLNSNSADEVALKYAAVYRAFCSSTMSYQICEKFKNEKPGKMYTLEPYSEKQYAVILFADISGFTKLAATLSADELKMYIDEYFTILIRVINSNNGDIIKFCGDALIIMWPFPPDIEHSGRQAGAVFASLCALQLLSECDSYVRVVPGSDTVVNLRLHCSISCGIVHCMCLGELQRWEFLVAGTPLQEVGIALNSAEAGSVCITADVQALVAHVLQCIPMPRDLSGDKEAESCPAIEVFMLTGELTEESGTEQSGGFHMQRNDSLITTRSMIHCENSPSPALETVSGHSVTLDSFSTASSAMFKDLVEDSSDTLSRCASLSRAHSALSDESPDTTKKSSTCGVVFARPVSTERLTRGLSIPSIQEGESFEFHTDGAARDHNNPHITVDNVAKAMGALSSDAHPALNKERSRLAHYFIKRPSLDYAGSSSFFIGSQSESKEFTADALSQQGVGMRSLQNFSFNEIEVTEADCDGSENLSYRRTASEQQQCDEVRDLEKLLTTNANIAAMHKKFVPASAVAAIESNTAQYLGELRRVVTLFIDIVNLEEDFQNGMLERPQQVFKHAVRPLLRFGGMLRQYVVDDKGCVLIMGFGLPGCNYEDNAARALETAVVVRRNLNSLNVICRIGIAEGDVYCGLVGTQSRCEYVMMGASVNLAARLMGKAGQNEIFVSGDVYMSSSRDFVFKQVPSVKAKGYVLPVAVYTPTARSNQKGTLLDEVDRESTGKLFVGRQKELNAIVESIYAFANEVSVTTNTPRSRPSSISRGAHGGGSSGSLNTKSSGSSIRPTSLLRGLQSIEFSSYHPPPTSTPKFQGARKSLSPPHDSSRRKRNSTVDGKSDASPGGQSSVTPRHTIASRVHVITGVAGAGKSWFLSEVCFTTQNVLKNLFVCSGFSAFALSSFSVVRELLQQVFSLNSSLALLQPMSVPSLSSNNVSGEGSAPFSEHQNRNENEDTVKAWISEKLPDITIEESYLMASLEKSGGILAASQKSLRLNKNRSAQDSSDSTSFYGASPVIDDHSKIPNLAAGRTVLQHQFFSSNISVNSLTDGLKGGSGDDLESKQRNESSNSTSTPNFSSDNSFAHRYSSEVVDSVVLETDSDLSFAQRREASDSSAIEEPARSAMSAAPLKPALSVITSSASTVFGNQASDSTASPRARHFEDATVAVNELKADGQNRPRSVPYAAKGIFFGKSFNPLSPKPPLSPKVSARNLLAQSNTVVDGKIPAVGILGSAVNNHMNTEMPTLSPLPGSAHPGVKHMRASSTMSMLSVPSGTLHRTNSFVRRDSATVTPRRRSATTELIQDAPGEITEAAVDNLCFVTDYAVDELLPLLNEILPVRFPETEVTLGLSVERRMNLLEVLIFNILKAALDERDTKSLLVIENLQWVDISSLRILYGILLDMSEVSPLNCFVLSTLRVHDNQKVGITVDSNNTMEYKQLLHKFVGMCDKTHLRLFDKEEVKRTLELSLVGLPVFKQKDSSADLVGSGPRSARPSLTKADGSTSLWDTGVSTLSSISEKASQSPPTSNRTVNAPASLKLDVVSSEIMSDHVVSEILRRTDGLPFLVSSICSELKQAVETSTYRGIEYLSSDATKIIIWRCDQLTKPQQVALKIASVFGRDFVLGDLRLALQALNFCEIAANLHFLLNDIVNNSALLRWKSIGQTSKAPTTPPKLNKDGHGSSGLLHHVEAMSDDSHDNLQFEFADQSVVEAVYSLMLGSQRSQVHEIIGDLNEARYLKASAASSIHNSSVELQPHQIYDLVVHYRKSGNVEKNVKYLTLAAKSAYYHNNTDSANLLLLELVKIGSGGLSVPDILLNALNEPHLPVELDQERNRGNSTSAPTSFSELKEKYGALASLSLSIDTNLPSPDKTLRASSVISPTPSFMSPTAFSGSNGSRAGRPSPLGISPEDYARSRQQSLKAYTPRGAVSGIFAVDVKTPVSATNGPNFSPQPKKQFPALERRNSEMNLRPYVDPYFETKKWYTLGDIKTKYRCGCTFITEQAAAENLSLLSLLMFRIGEMQQAHNLAMLFIHKIALPMVDPSAGTETMHSLIDFEALRVLRTNSTEYRTEISTGSTVPGPTHSSFGSVFTNGGIGSTLEAIEEAPINPKGHEKNKSLAILKSGEDSDVPSETFDTPHSDKRNRKSFSTLKEFLTFKKGKMTTGESSRILRDDFADDIKTSMSLPPEDTSSNENSYFKSTKPVSNIHISALKELVEANPTLFETYWKVIDRLISVSLMRGHLSMAEALYSIFTEHNSGMSVSDNNSTHNMSSVYSSTHSSIGGSVRSSDSVVSHLTPPSLLGKEDGVQLKAVLSTLQLLAGQTNKAQYTMGTTIKTVNPMQDQYAWASCLLHRSLHSAAVCAFYDARVDLIGASTSFSVVSDSNNYLLALVLHGWYGFFSGGNVHDIDSFIASMENKIASDKAAHEKNVFLRRSLANDNLKLGAADSSAMEAGFRLSPSRDDAISSDPLFSKSRRQGNDLVSSGRAGLRRESTRMSIRIDDMAVALERMLTNASETAQLSVSDAAESLSCNDTAQLRSRSPVNSFSDMRAANTNIVRTEDAVASILLPGGAISSHIVQWVDDLALMRLFIQQDYAGVKNRDAATKTRRRRDTSTYVAAVLLANIACKEGRLDEAHRLTMYAVRQGIARDIVHPVALFLLFLVGLAAVSTMGELAANYAYVAPLIDEEDSDEETSATDAAEPATEINFEIDSDDYQDFLIVAARRRHYRQLRRAVLVVINTLGKLDFCVFPGYILLRYILIAKKNRLESNGSLREFLTSFDRIIDDTSSQFMIGLAYAYEEREFLCEAIGISSNVCPSANAVRSCSSHVVSQAFFDELATNEYSEGSDLPVDGFSSISIFNHAVFPWHFAADIKSGREPESESKSVTDGIDLSELARRLLNPETETSSTSIALESQSSELGFNGVSFSLYLPKSINIHYPALTSKLTITQIESLKNIMRPFNIRNPYAFVGCWAMKKKGHDRFYKRRFVWIDPFEKLFFWSKIEQCVTPTVDLRAYDDRSSNIRQGGDGINERFILYPSGSRMVRNQEYYYQCDLSKSKCIPFSDVLKIETSVSSIQEIRRDTKPVPPVAASPRRFSPPSPQLVRTARRVSAPASLALSVPRTTNESPRISESAGSSSHNSPGSASRSGITPPNGQNFKVADYSATSTMAENLESVIDDVLCPLSPPKKRLSLMKYFGSSIKKVDGAGRPPTHPPSPAELQKQTGEQSEFFKFKFKLKDENEIDLKLFLDIGASEGGLPMGPEVPSEILCNDWVKLAEYCAKAQHHQQNKKRWRS